jgi:hypothetical protein
VVAGVDGPAVTSRLGGGGVSVIRVEIAVVRDPRAYAFARCFWVTLSLQGRTCVSRKALEEGGTKREKSRRTCDSRRREE